MGSSSPIPSLHHRSLPLHFFTSHGADAVRVFISRIHAYCLNANDIVSILLPSDLQLIVPTLCPEHKKRHHGNSKTALNVEESNVTNNFLFPNNEGVRREQLVSLQSKIAAFGAVIVDLNHALVIFSEFVHQWEVEKSRPYHVIPTKRENNLD